MYIKNNILIDHGNHICTNNYVNTKLYLIHYTKRTDIQFKKKIINNVTGFNYEKNVSNLKSKLNINQTAKLTIEWYIYKKKWLNKILFK